MAHGPPAVVVENLSKSYGRGDGAVAAVDDVSFTVPRGSVVGILGPNGAGKTTTIKSILGTVSPTAGTVWVDGVDVDENPLEAYRRVSAVLEGARNVYWRLTVRENLAFFARLQGHDAAADADRHERYLETLNFGEKADETVRTLSLGMKQKTALACAFARKTPVLFLDEPTLGLDVETSRDLGSELRRLVETEGRTVVLSSHDMDTVQQLCDRVVIMNRGRVVADEAVPDLIELLRTQSYRIAVDGDLPEPTWSRLRGAHNATGLESTGDGVAFEVLLETGAALYDCMDRLRDAGVEPVSVQSLEPDLEEAFLRVLDRDRNAEGAADAPPVEARDG